MKKVVADKLLGIIATLVISSLVVWMATNVWGAWMEHRAAVAAEAQAEYEASLAQPLARLETTSVTCTTSATQIRPHAMKSAMIINTSATAVYVGGPDVDGSTAGTTGVDVCDGCTAGKTLSIDSREAYCVVGAGTVAVEVLYGVQ